MLLPKGPAPAPASTVPSVAVATKRIIAKEIAIHNSKEQFYHNHRISLQFLYLYSPVHPGVICMWMQERERVPGEGEALHNGATLLF